MSAEDLNKTLAELQAEAAEVDAELRRRRDELEKSRKRYQALLQSIGLEHEDLMAIVEEGGFHPEAEAMMRKARAEELRAAKEEEEAGDADAESSAEESTKRKKRLIVKL